MASARSASDDLEDANGVKKIRFLLDSGANESMMKDARWANRTWKSKTEIKTANPSLGINASLMGSVEVTNDLGQTIPGLDRVIFTPELRENLLSVGRLADAGYTVLFNACGVKVYRNRGLRVTGREVHYESRDSEGLYPMTLTPTLPTKHLLSAPPQEVRAHLASAMSTAQQVVRNARVGQSAKVVLATQGPLPVSASDNEILSNLARVYPREDMSVLEKWHTRCGHASVKALKKMGIKELQGKKIPNKYRCEGCIKGKIHRIAHKEMHDQPKSNYKPGQCIATDLMGPYAKSIEGSKYAQLYKCATSKYRWLCTLSSKDLTTAATAQVIKDAKARSGRNVKFLKTDGDGMFRSKQFDEMQHELGFIHERAAPHDHNSNAVIERDIRTVFEGTATALQNSGAPSRFWADAMHHFIFTKNVLPVETMNKKGEKVVKSPLELLNPQCVPLIT